MCGINYRRFISWRICADFGNGWDRLGTIMAIESLGGAPQRFLVRFAKDSREASQNWVFVTAVWRTEEAADKASLEFTRRPEVLHVDDEINLPPRNVVKIRFDQEL